MLAVRSVTRVMLAGANSTPQLHVLRRGYHENIIEHYENPRNVGSLDKNDDDVGTVSGIICMLFGCFGGGMRDEATSPSFYMMIGASVDNPIMITIMFFVSTAINLWTYFSFFVFTMSDAKGLVGAPACGDVMKVHYLPSKSLSVVVNACV